MQHDYTSCFIPGKPIYDSKIYYMSWRIQYFHFMVLDMDIAQSSLFRVTLALKVLLQILQLIMH